MRKLVLAFCGLALLGCKSGKSPEEILIAAKEKFFAAENLSFSQTMYWENPNLGEVDTFKYDLQLQKYQNRYFGFNYIGKRKGYELSYLNEVLSSVNHMDSSVTYHSEEDSIRFKNIAADNTFLVFSPFLLRNEPWQFKQDTTIALKKLLNFFWIEMDTTISEKKILLENHIFVNPANLFVESLSRRLYHNGKSNQLIEVHFSNYVLSNENKALVTNVPPGYLSKVDNQEKTESSKLLVAGSAAPDFDLLDLDGNRVRLSDFRGKKVLLDFSMINCGWCKIALDDFNKPDFQFAENIVPLYINPVDTPEKMKKYVSKVNVPFPVLTEAKAVGEAYGVNGYPTFILVDELGKIEVVEVGYSDGLSKKFGK